MVTKLRRIQDACRDWSKKDLGNINQKLAQLKEQLTILQTQEYKQEIAELEKRKQQELQLLLDMEETFWAQKARKDWIA